MSQLKKDLGLTIKAENPIQPMNRNENRRTRFVNDDPERAINRLVMKTIVKPEKLKNRDTDSTARIMLDRDEI